MNCTIKQDRLTPEEFAELFQSAGWTPPESGQIKAALENSLAVFSAVSGNNTVGMARIVGDGAMTFFIKDVVVAPGYQGKGVGSLLISAIENYIVGNTEPGWAASVELIAASGKELFYKKHGFRTDCGTGMMKMIRR